MKKWFFDLVYCWCVLAFVLSFGFKALAVNTYENSHKPNDRGWLSKVTVEKHLESDVKWLFIFDMKDCKPLPGEVLNLRRPGLKLNEGFMYMTCVSKAEELCKRD